MAEGFKIADAYVEVVTEFDRGSAMAAAVAAGERAGKAMGEKISTESARTFQRDSGSKFLPAGDRIGSEMGGAGARSLYTSLTRGFGSLAGMVGTNPYILAAGVAVGTALTPMIGAAISAGVIGGTGLGVIGLGAILLREEPALVRAATKLKTRATSIFKTAAKPMLQPFVDSLVMFRKLLNDQEPAIRQMFKNLAPAIVPLATAFTDLIRNAMPGILALTETAGPMLIALGPGIAKLGTAFSLFAMQIAAVAPEATIFFTDLLTWVGGVIVGAGYLIATLTRMYVSFRTFFMNIPGWVSTAWSAITGWVSGVSGTVGRFFTVTIPGWFASAWSAITGWASRTGSAVGGFFSGLWSAITGWVVRVTGAVGGFFTGTVPGWFNSARSTISGWLSAVGGFFARLPGQIMGVLTALPGQVVALFWTVFDGAGYVLGYGIGMVIGFFARLPGQVWAFMTAVGQAFLRGVETVVGFAMSLPGRIAAMWATIGNLFMIGVGMVVGFLQSLPGRALSVWSAVYADASRIVGNVRASVTNIIRATVDGVVGYLTALPGRAAGAVSALWGRISGAFTSARDRATSTASSLVSGVAGTLAALPGRAASAVSSVTSRISGVLRTAVGAAREIGADIIRGMIQGITSMIGAAIAAVKRAVGNIISGAKDALEIGSPSRVANREVGRWFLPGVVQGVQRSVPAARKAIGVAVRSAFPGTTGMSRPPAAPSSGGAGGGGGTHYHFGPGSITLDASKVRSIQDVVALIEGLTQTSRATHATTT